MFVPEQPSANRDRGLLYRHVDPTDPQCLKQILELTKALAWRRFGVHPDGQDLVNDAVSLAWEFSQRGNGTPYTVAKFAIRRAASNGQFSRTARSIDHSQPRENKARRTFFDGNAISAFDGNPARIAAFRIDFRSWLQTLTARQREVAEHLALGNNDTEVARILGCTRSNVWIIRQTLKQRYDAFVAEVGEEPA